MSQGVGTSAHIFGEVFAKQAGIDIVHVPYKGANDVANDFIAGRVQLQFASSSAAVNLVKSGQVRLIAVVVPRRSALFPDLPTMAEQGVASIDIESWVGLRPGRDGAADGRATQRSDRPGAQASRSCATTSASAASRPRVSTPEQFAGIVRDSYMQWGRVIAQIGLAKE